MPQMNKGGKFIFGESVIRQDGLVQFPPQAADEYHIASEGKVYLFTGSKITGGFCVTRQGLLLPSMLGHILTETPELLRYEVPAGTFLSLQGAGLLLDAHLRDRPDQADGRNDGASASGA